MRQLLRDRWPSFARELEALLAESSEPQLADTVQSLEFFGWCACRDDFCQTFYTAALSGGPYPSDVYTVELHPGEGMVNVDVLGGKIVGVEALFRGDLRSEQ